MAELTPIIKFLSVLSKNNNRAWFSNNKAAYLIAKQHFDNFLGDVLQALVAFDKGLINLDPKKLSFRIYRDVRFSKDKRPYKTNMGAGISPKGKMVEEPGYYIHIEPGNKSFVAGGIYMPSSANLNKIRQEIDYDFKKLNDILGSSTFNAWYTGLDDFGKLKTAPKGYPKDHPQINLLRHKNFMASHPFSDKEVGNKKFLQHVVKACKSIKPLNDFLAEAIA